MIAIAEIVATIILTMTPFELGETPNQTRNQINTLHLVETVQWTDNYPADPNESPSLRALTYLRSNRTYRSEVWVDRIRKLTKIIETDIRDLNTLSQQYGIKPILFDTSTLLCIQQDWVTYTVYQSNGEKVLVLERTSEMHPRGQIFAKHTWRGTIDPLVVGANDLTIDEDANRISFTSGCPAGRIQTTIEYLPALDYKFTTIRQHFEGKLIKEITAGDYRRINGIYYPFTYTEKSFDIEGTLQRAEIYNVESVELNPVLTDAVFTATAERDMEIMDITRRGLRPVLTVPQGSTLPAEAIRLTRD